MSNYNWAHFEAMRVLIETYLPSMSSNNHVILRIAQANELNWVNIIDEFDQLTTGGFQPPYTLIALGQQNADDFGGLHNATVRIPTWVYYIRRKAVNSTTVTTGAASATQTVADTSWMAQGMPLDFGTAGVRVVDSIASATSVVLTATVTTVTAQAVSETEVGDAMEAVMSIFRDAVSAHSGGGFQATDIPSIDCSESNAANLVFARQLGRLYAGALYFPALCGETFPT